MKKQYQGIHRCLAVVTQATRRENREGSANLQQGRCCEVKLP